jgi:hypothetical protein
LFLGQSRQVSTASTEFAKAVLEQYFRHFFAYIPSTLSSKNKMRFSTVAIAALSCGFATAAPVSDMEYTPVSKRGLNINAFLAMIVELFPVNVTVDGICGVLGVGETALAAAFGLNINANSKGCADVTIVFARGTCDPGNVGALVGPPFLNAVKSAIGSSKSVTVQGVAYPASVDGYLRADPAAGVTM